jgi:3-oxoadipate enol-lactonase
MSRNQPAAMGYLPVAGAELYYEVVGDGPPVVLIHAGIADLTMWDAQAAALALSHTVIRFDCRGFGRTRFEPVAFSNRQDVADLLDHLGLARAAVVGCSRGGQIALDFAIERPERVSRLVWVCSGVGGWEAPDELFQPEEIALWEAMEAAEAAGEHENVAALDVRVWVDGPLQPEGRAAEAVRRKVYTMALQNYQAHSHRMGEGFAPQPLEPPALGRLGEVRAPTLAIVGELDPAATAAAAAILAQGVPNCRVERFPDCAHLPNLEQPERFNQLLLAFLSGV